MMTTDREGSDREVRRPTVSSGDEASRRAVVQLVSTLTALAFGRPVSAGETEAPEQLVYGTVLARRIARISAGSLLLVAAVGLGVIALRDPAVLVAACVVTWVGGTLTYALVRVILAVGGWLARRRGARSVSHDTARFRAYRLQNASTLVPYVGVIVTFVLPLGWMVSSLGAGDALSILAMIASALVAYLGLRAALERELVELGIDAVGQGQAP
jgi:hypothetical protein